MQSYNEIKYLLLILTFIFIKISIDRYLLVNLLIKKLYNNAIISKKKYANIYISLIIYNYFYI